VALSEQAWLRVRPEHVLLYANERRVEATAANDAPTPPSPADAREGVSG